MCGICGIIHFDANLVCSASIKSMMAVMKRRGPDDEGVFTAQNIGLGHVRLSILDLSPAGHQPMFSHNKRFVVVFNGEIFNYLELRDQLKVFGYRFKTKTDTEVLLAAYQHWGRECLDRFNGMWAFAIYDRENKSLFTCRDRYGIKPFYYLAIDHVFAFSSEIQPLLALLPGKPRPNYQTIFDYLVFNRTDQTESTFFHEIKKLQHGHFLSIDTLKGGPDRFFVKKWYNLGERVNNSKGFSSPGEFRDVLNSSVGLRLRSDVPVGVCLSGGLDSSSIASILVRDYQIEGLNTFSAVYDPGQNGDESGYIDLLKPNIKKMHFVKPTGETLLKDIEDFIKAHAEPMPSTSPYAQYKVMELAKEHVVVTLDGQGADEQLAGYNYFYGFFFKGLLRDCRLGTLFSEMAHYGLTHKSFYAYKTLIYFLMPKFLRTKLRANRNTYVSKELYHQYAPLTKIGGELYGAKNLQDAFLKHFEYKLEHLLKWEDRNSMWFSLEARVPFLDYRLVEKMLASDGSAIIRRGINKNILREAMHGTIPAAIEKRIDKVGFGTPQDDWLKAPAFRRHISKSLNSETFAAREFLDSFEAVRLLDHYNHGLHDSATDVWKCMNLEHWFREFID